MMDRRIISLVRLFAQFLPLSIFAAYAFADGAPTTRRWLEAFSIGAGLALARLGLLRWRNIPINPLILGTDLYLVLGTAICLSRNVWLTEVLAAAQATGVLAAILVAGVITTFNSARGFVAAENTAEGTVLKSSMVLLGITVGATAVSYSFRGNTTYSGVLPVIAIALSQRVLRLRVEGSRKWPGREKQVPS